ncbi:MAG: type II toxin-antitoxin system VapC family toxin [Longimicrobiaceae bacterium]
MNHVLDACAMLAYLTGEDGAVVVDELLRDPSHDCYAHSLNLCEVYYDITRRADAVTADQAIADLKAAGLVEHSDLDAELWRAAGNLKATGRISLADCFCIALAQRLDATLVTSDHHEFDAIVPRNLCPVRFIR